MSQIWRLRGSRLINFELHPGAAIPITFDKEFMRYAIIIAIAALIAVAAMFLMPWDGGPFAWMPSEEEVSTRFEERHSELKVVKVSAGYGDNDQRSYTIEYTSQGSKETKFAVWQVHSAGRFYGWELDSERLNEQ